MGVDSIWRHWRGGLLASLVAAGLAGMVLPARLTHHVRGALGTAFVPGQAGVAWLRDRLGAVVRPLVTSWRRGERVEVLEAEVARLRRENAQLLQRLAEREQDLAQALSLRRASGAADLEFTVAPVIGRDSTSWASTVTVGRGWRSGVRPGELVLEATDRLIAAGTRDGVARGDTVLDPPTAAVVGRVTAVGPFHSVVRLVTDPGSVLRAQVLAVRDGEPERTASGILLGSQTGAPRLRLEYVDRRHDVRPGDLVLTSGYGGILPAPLLVGRIEEVAASSIPLLSRITVVPEADVEAIERVVIVHERVKWPAAGSEKAP